VENGSSKTKRRKTPWVVGTIMVVSLIVLIILQSTNLWKDFTVESSSDLLLLYALSSINFAALVIFGFIFLRSIIKLVRERRTFQLGAKIKTRLLTYFFAVTLMPIIAMAVFSYLFMNRALERWFTQIPENVVREAREVQHQSIADRAATLDESARMMAAIIGDAEPSNGDLRKIAEAGNLAHIEILSSNGGTVAQYGRDETRNQPELGRLIDVIRSGSFSDPSLRDSKVYDAAIVEMTGGRKLAIIPNPIGARAVSQIVENSLREFDLLKDKQITVRRVGLLTLGVLTFLLIFASSWIAFYVARGLTAPIKALAEGAEEVAQGNFGHRVEVFAEDELSMLVSAFNEMSATLESNSKELSERRKYIETVLETLPTGVISFDRSDKITTINGSAADILGIKAETGLKHTIADGFTGENRLIFERLLSRARRVGNASIQASLKNAGNKQNDGGDELTVAMTATRLPTDGGVVLVLEDLSELIAAQRASAWQEVARRMAHEIKNPLTPIQLSAERIAKRFEQSTPSEAQNGNEKRTPGRGPLAAVVNESTATILREVASLKTLVDEFSRFARLPDTRLEPGNVNDAIARAVAGFEDRVSQPNIEQRLAGDLPLIMLDPEQMKRIFVNMIENAIEASDSDIRQSKIVITTRHDLAREIVVAEVSDNGKGIVPGDLQKLFQPYFSTKGRGTGLGLAIVNRIIADHHGKIKVAASQQNGAKFIIELPVSA